MKPLVVIPARGGSKGVPGKNIKLLGGKPLIQYTIEAAREVFEDDVICVSTDDLKIKEVVENIGLEVPFLRPPELATDTAGSDEVLIHALNYYEERMANVDTIILLQATSPFRTAKHIEEALQIFDGSCDMVVSVKVTTSNPYYTLMEEDSKGWLRKSKDSNFLRRQDCPPVYEVNGAIYIIKASILKTTPVHQIQKKRKYVMNETASVDIDNELDWYWAECLVNKNMG